MNVLDFISNSDFASIPISPPISSPLRSNCVVLNVNNTNEHQRQANIFLGRRALKHNITISAINDFLGWLSTEPNLSLLPLDAKNLLKTPRNLNIQSMGQGFYYYFGLKYGICKFFEKYGNSEVFLFKF